jgi:hypothetical protein
MSVKIVHGYNATPHSCKYAEENTTNASEIARLIINLSNDPICSSSKKR